MKWHAEAFFLKTAILITIIYSVNIVVFLVILPFGTIALKRITTLPAIGIDLLVARCSLGLLAGGALIIGFANSIALMFLGALSNALFTKTRQRNN